MTDTEAPIIDERLLHRVRSLLAKAESSDFAEEAAAFTAKAHQLMAAHAIEVAMLDERRGDASVTSTLIVLPAPYAKDKYLLLSRVAAASGCTAILGIEDPDRIFHDPDLRAEFTAGNRVATVLGHRSDLEVVEVLFTSLLLQATNVMLAQGSVISDWGTNRTRAFRHAFLVGFATTVGQRLEQSRPDATTEADRNPEANVLPVLADRSHRVDEAVAAAFPRLGSFSTSISDGEGLLAGRNAGHRADIGHRRVQGVARLGTSASNRGQ